MTLEKEQVFMSSGYALALPRSAFNFDNIAFCIDSTGSMGGVIRAFQSLIVEITTAYFAARKHIALVRYGDSYEFHGLTPLNENALGAPEVVVDFTTDAELFIAGVNDLKAEGGGDTDEKGLSGLHVSLSVLDWPNTGSNLVILATDAGPKDPEDFSFIPGTPFNIAGPGLSSATVGAEYNAAGYTVYALVANSSTELAQWQAIIPSSIPGQVFEADYDDLSGLGETMLDVLGIPPTVRPVAIAVPGDVTVTETDQQSVRVTNKTQVTVPRAQTASASTVRREDFNRADSLYKFGNLLPWREGNPVLFSSDGATVLEWISRYPIATVSGQAALYSPYWSAEIGSHWYSCYNEGVALSYVAQGVEEAVDVRATAVIGAVLPLVPGSFGAQEWTVTCRAEANVSLSDNNEGWKFTVRRNLTGTFAFLTVANGSGPSGVFTEVPPFAIGSLNTGDEISIQATGDFFPAHILCMINGVIVIDFTSSIFARNGFGRSGGIGLYAAAYDLTETWDGNGLDGLMTMDSFSITLV